MSALPSVSVVMTVYNSERFLRQAVESILNQTWADFEFIIVDNASTDNSKVILSSYHDSRIRIIWNSENLGQTKALNIGITQSRGALIARMDADDISAPDRIEKQVRYLQMNVSIVAVGSWCQDINEEGKDLKVFKTPTDPFWIRSFLCGSGELTKWCMTHPSVMMRKKALEEAGGYDETKSFPGYPQDYDLWSRLIFTGDFSNIPELLLKYRVLEKSESRSFAEDTRKYCLEISRNRIRKVCSDLSDGDVELLARMLEALPQPGKTEAKRVLNIFRKYFYAYMGMRGNTKVIENACLQIQAYYLPQLFMTDPLFSLKTFFVMLIRRPSLLFDRRWHMKWGKVLLKTAFPESRYQVIKRKLFHHR